MNNVISAAFYLMHENILRKCEFFLVHRDYIDTVITYLFLFMNVDHIHIYSYLVYKAHSAVMNNVRKQLC